MNWLNHFLRKALTPTQDTELQFMLNTLRISNMPENLVVAYEKEYLLPLALSNNRSYNQRKIQQLAKIQQEDYPDAPAKVTSAIYRLGITTRNPLYLEPAQKVLKELALMGSINAQNTLHHDVEKEKKDPQYHLKKLLITGIRRYQLSAKKTKALANHLFALIQNSSFNDEVTIRHIERIAESENSREGAYVCYALSLVEHPYKAIARETLASMFYTYGNTFADKLIQKHLRIASNLPAEYLPLIDKLRILNIWLENKEEQKAIQTPIFGEIRNIGIQWCQEKGDSYLDKAMAEINSYEPELLPVLKLCWKEIDLYV